VTQVTVPRERTPGSGGRRVQAPGGVAAEERQGVWIVVGAGVGMALLLGVMVALVTWLV
jgi:hypothetical protein